MMKFLCLSCDEGMKLEAASGPREGSLQATFVCPRCRCRVAMLTNPWETQLLQTLGVRVGGRATPTSPYEQVLSSLVRSRSEVQRVGENDLLSPGCPFAEMLGPAEETKTEEGIRWTDPAKMRIERIPSFIRPMVQRAIERYALEKGHQLISEAIIDEARSQLGM